MYGFVHYLVEYDVLRQQNKRKNKTACIRKIFFVFSGVTNFSGKYRPDAD